MNIYYFCGLECPQMMWTRVYFRYKNTMWFVAHICYQQLRWAVTPRYFEIHHSLLYILLEVTHWNIAMIRFWPRIYRITMHISLELLKHGIFTWNYHIHPSTSGSAKSCILLTSWRALVRLVTKGFQCPVQYPTRKKVTIKLWEVWFLIWFEN